MACIGDCRKCLLAAEEQPHGPEWVFADGVMIRTMIIPHAGTTVPQHSHIYDHTSFVACGIATLIHEDGRQVRIVGPAPAPPIKAGVKHLFRAEVDGTTVLCIHNIPEQAALKSVRSIK